MHQSVYPLATLSNTFRPINNIEKNIYEKTKSTNPYIYIYNTLKRFQDPLKITTKKKRKRKHKSIEKRKMKWTTTKSTNLISIRELEMGATIGDLGASGIFACVGEAYPPPIRHWFLQVYVNWVEHCPLLHIHCFSSSVHVFDSKCPKSTKASKPTQINEKC
jgi:ABC-type amino acid transport system permease subunit